MPAPQSLTNLALERRAEEKALGDLATAYAFFGSTQDHADAMSATCKWAIIFGFEPAACWVLTPMLAAKRPTHAVAFHKGTSPPVSGSHHRRGSIWGNLDGMGGDQVALWVHGHSHTAVDYDVAGTRVVCNPRGYPGEDTDFKPNLVLVV